MVLSRIAEEGPWANLEIMAKGIEADFHHLLLACSLAGAGGCDHVSPAPRPWLYIRSKDGELVASIMPDKGGSCLLQCRSGKTWDIIFCLDDGDPWITVSVHGQLIVQARRRGRYYGGSALQVDMQHEPGSLEAT